MPNAKMNIGVLRNGVQRRRARSTEDKNEADTRLPVRDHYERFEQYMKRQYPKRKQDIFAEKELMRQAEAADRNTPLGIIDTVAREFIIFWMPELEMFLADNAYDDAEVEREAYKRFANGLEDHIMLVSDRVDCSRAKHAATLRDALQNRAMQYLADLYQSCEEVLQSHEKFDFDPQQRSTRRAKLECQNPSEVFSEARTLNSSLVWSLTDDSKRETHKRTPSPRARRLSPIRQLDYAEAADNGQAWGNPEAGIGSRKFEVEITNTIKISGFENLQRFSKFKRQRQYMTDDNTVDLTTEEDSCESLAGGLQVGGRFDEDVAGDAFVDTSEFPLPGAFD